MNQSNYEPLLLSTLPLLNQYWEASSPLIEQCIQNTMRVEITLEDIYGALTRGELFMFVVKADLDTGPDVELVVILQPLPYPRLPAMNILGLAGRNLASNGKKYWGYLQGWMYMSGVRAIEAYVSPAMERIVKRFGFNRTSVHVRLPLNHQ